MFSRSSGSNSSTDFPVCLRRFHPCWIVWALFLAGSTVHGQQDVLFDTRMYAFDPLSSHLATSDLDGDGRLDLIAAGLHGMTVLHGQGNGRFQEVSLYVTSSKTRSVILGDVDNDARTDCVVATVDSTLYVFRGQGDGTFEEWTTLHARARVIALAIVDLDADGDQDILVAPNDSWVSHFLNDGNGGFVRNQTNYGTVLHAIQVSDIDGDSYQDIVYSNEAQTWVKKRATSGYMPPVGYAGGAGPGGLLLADLNADGLQDLVTADPHSTHSAMYVRLGIGAGRFGSRTQYVGSSGGPSRALSAADLDGDSHLDLVAVTNSDLMILRGRGNGSFDSWQQFPAGPASILSADFDQDGRLDLGLAGYQEGEHSWSTILLGNGDGTFGSLPQPSPMPCKPSNIVLNDFDNDGWLDLAALNHEHQGLVILRGLEGGSFLSPGYETGVTCGPVWPSVARPSLASGDLDNDGHIDLVAAVTDWGTGLPDPFELAFPCPVVEVLQGTGRIDQFQRSHAATGPRPRYCLLEDVNHDGALDIDVSSDSALVTVSLGNGDATFGRPIGSGLGNHPVRSIGLGRFDDDIHLDLAVAVEDSLFLLLGNGDGRFHRSFERVLQGASGMNVGDLNEDGNMDLLLSSNRSYRMLLFLSDGRGGFTDGLLDAPWLYANLADIDADGHLDIVANPGSSSNWSLVVIYRGRGDGTFFSAVGLGIGERFPAAPSVADVTRDGRPDLVVVGECAVSVLANISSSTGIGLEDANADRDADRVRLTWRLGANALAAASGVRIDRGFFPQGPFTRLTDVPLTPTSSMSYMDQFDSPENRDIWYRIVLLDAAENILNFQQVEILAEVARLQQTSLLPPRVTPDGAAVQIRYVVAGATEQVGISIFDVAGHRLWTVAITPHERGTYMQTWNRRVITGDRASRGVYLIRLDAPTAPATEKLVLLGR